MCIVGKMTQDVGWCESVGLVAFEASIPTCTCFHEGKLFVTCFCCFFFFFVLSFRNGKRRKVGEEAEGKMHGQLFCYHKRTIILKSFQVKL